jgi:hypothetical protein
MVTQQAELIAYIDDFRLLAAILIISIPVVLIMRNPHRRTETIANST